MPKKKPKKPKALITDLVMKGQIARSQCAPLKGARSAADAATKKKKGPKSVLGKLWGSGKGKFRTDGKYSSATVRGTIWLVQDRCDGHADEGHARDGPGARLQAQEDGHGEGRPQLPRARSGRDQRSRGAKKEVHQTNRFGRSRPRARARGRPRRPRCHGDDRRVAAEHHGQRHRVDPDQLRRLGGRRVHATARAARIRGLHRVATAHAGRHAERVQLHGRRGLSIHAREPSPDGHRRRPARQPVHPHSELRRGGRRHPVGPRRRADRLRQRQLDRGGRLLDHEHRDGLDRRSLVASSCPPTSTSPATAAGSASFTATPDPSGRRRQPDERAHAPRSSRSRRGRPIRRTSRDSSDPHERPRQQQALDHAATDPRSPTRSTRIWSTTAAGSAVRYRSPAHPWCGSVTSPARATTPARGSFERDDTLRLRRPRWQRLAHVNTEPRDRPSLSQPPPPVPGKSVIVNVVSGQVLIKLGERCARGGPPRASSRSPTRRTSRSAPSSTPARAASS